jgi:sterol desaturase/sphingolipid hydroxylase (fatty acid hydroxylase superfamily)
MQELFIQINNLDLDAFKESYNLIFYFFGLPLIVLITIKEIYLQRKTKVNYIDKKELKTDFSFFVVKGLMGFINNAFLLFVHMFAWEYKVYQIHLDSVIMAIIYLLIADLIYYLIHIYSHKVKLGWMTHFVHHSLIKINALASGRLGYTTILSCAWLIPIPFIIIGFHPLWIHLFLFVIASYQVWVHTETIGRLETLDLFLNTPENHRLHHSTVAEHRDKNLGGMFMFWDHLFGTYMRSPGKEYIQYGVAQTPTEGLGHLGLLKESFRVFRN